MKAELEVFHILEWSPFEDHKDEEGVDGEVEGYGGENTAGVAVAVRGRVEVLEVYEAGPVGGVGEGEEVEEVCEGVDVVGCEEEGEEGEHGDVGEVGFEVVGIGVEVPDEVEGGYCGIEEDEAEIGLSEYEA